MIVGLPVTDSKRRTARAISDAPAISSDALSLPIRELFPPARTKPPICFSISMGGVSKADSSPDAPADSTANFYIMLLSPILMKTGNLLVSLQPNPYVSEELSALCLTASAHVLLLALVREEC